MIHPGTQINAAELIERLERNRDEWLKDAAAMAGQERPHSTAMALHIAQGVNEAIDEVKDLAK